MEVNEALKTGASHHFAPRKKPVMAGLTTLLLQPQCSLKFTPLLNQTAPLSVNAR